MMKNEWINNNGHLLNIKELFYLINAIFDKDCYGIDFELTEIAKKCLEVALKKRLRGVSLAKIVGKKMFYNHYFLTNNYTLDPRPETEFLIDEINGNPKTILELGVGSGCLILSILKKYKKLKGIGVDICKNALLVASKNAKILDLDKRVKFLENDWANGLTGHFDIIVSNPPYILKEDEKKLSKEVLFDPKISLFGDINTYVDLMNSLKNITFNQLLLEMPESLLNDFVFMYRDIYNLEYKRIYNTNIFCMNVLNTKK